MPSTETERNRIESHLKSSLQRVADSHAVRPTRIRSYPGHSYTQIPMRCPACSGRLALRHPEMMENAAYAQATCQCCEWWGHAVYRLIDLMEYDEGKQSGTFDMIPFHSAVRTAGVEPTYFPYD